MTVYLNGKYLPLKRAQISVLDHGFLYGDGIYETLLVEEGKPHFLEEHLRRLFLSLRRVGIRPPLKQKALQTVVRNVVRKNPAPQSVLRIIITRGPGPFGFNPHSCRKPTLFVSSQSHSGYPTDCYRKGIRVAVISGHRIRPDIKSTSCLNSVLAKAESLRQNCEEGLFLSKDGHVTEGTVSNVFMVKKNVLYTPALTGALLAGVTRQTVLAVAKKAGYKTKEKKLTLAELLSADEIFLTNSLMGVMPVAKLGRFQAEGFPVTWHLAALYKAAYL